MLKIGDYKIYRFDKFNIVFEYPKEIESKATKEKRYEQTIGGYYSTLSQCLNGIKQHIILSNLNEVDNEGLIKMLDEMNNAIVNCELRVEEGKEEI